MEEIIKQSKETVLIIITGVSGILANFMNKIRKWEKISMSLFFVHFILSWFVGVMAYLLLSQIMHWMQLWFYIWLVCYWWMKIIDALDMITAKSIYNYFKEFIEFKLWKKK